MALQRTDRHGSRSRCSLSDSRRCVVQTSVCRGRASRRAARVSHPQLADEQELQRRWPGVRPAPLDAGTGQVTDPRNFGACLRTADAAGRCCHCAKAQQAPLSAVALKTAQGGAEDLFIVQVTNLARTLSWLRDQGVWLFGADAQGDEVWQSLDSSTATALVMGSEGSGLRRLTRSLCDKLVSIPMLGNVESLNVSVATGILLYEAVRQRRTAKQ